MRHIVGVLKFFSLYLIMAIVCFSLIYWVGVDYSFNDFNSYTTVLISVSGMVFTIMGIWIAFLYPNALQRLVNPTKIVTADFSEELNEAKRLESIVGSILKSAFVLVTLMVIFLLKLVIFKTDFYLSYRLLFKCASLTIVIVLSYAQIEAVFQVMKANLLFINDLHFKREQREVDEEI